MPDDTAIARADLLAAVERSPAAAGAHDREAWVALFAATGEVEDPVGSRPHRGPTALARFYDTFIAPRDITFHRDHDVVLGTTVVRDLELEVRMSSAVVMRIPAYLRYDVHADGDQLKIARLNAHWELPAMVVQFAGGGPAALPAGVALTRALLVNQGLAGSVGFLSGFRGVGRRGKRHVTGLLDDARAGDELAVRRRISDATLVTLGDDARLSSSELVVRLAGAQWRKPIAAGNSVAVAVERNGQRSIVIAELRARPMAIARLRLFTED